MPRDTNGNTSPLPGTLVSTGDTVLPSQHNPMVQDVYAMMTQSLSRDGQGGMLAALDMSGFRILNVASPVSDGDVATLGIIETKRTFQVRGSSASVTAADKNSNIRVTSASKQTLASGLSSGWFCFFQADGGNATIDTAGSEKINGADVMVLPDGYSTMVWFDGTNFFAREDFATVQSLAIPAGAIQPFARSTPPPTWLKANGAAVLIASYPALDAAIYQGDSLNATAVFGFRCTDPANTTGTRSIAGAYIVLPDLRGEFIRAWDDGRGVDSGRSFGTAQAADIISHTHRQNVEVTANVGAGTAPKGSATAGGGAADSYMFTDAFGGTETRPRNFSLLYCIKV